MDFGSSQIYAIELWAAGIRLADISNLAHNRTFTLQRNEAEQITFDLDIFTFETFAASIGANPRTLIQPYQTDVLVRRVDQNGVFQYWFGTQVVDITFNLTNDPANMSSGSIGDGAQSFNPTATVTCTGYLNLFKDRYVTNTYSGNERCFIAGDLITQAQAQTNGNVGVSLATGQYSTGITDTVRTYTRQNVKDGIQNLSQLTDGRFDFSFSYDKKFQTYAQLGSLRTDLQFTYGGSDSNVIGFYLDRTATNLYNQIIGLGSGFGADQLVSNPVTSGDTTSQLNNYLRQDIKQYNSVVDQATLDKNAAADLALEKDLLELPQITVTAAQLAGLTYPTLGDRIPLKVVGHPWLDNINGYYRVEKMVYTPDDNDFDTIMLYFDNYAVNGT